MVWCAKLFGVQQLLLITSLLELISHNVDAIVCYQCDATKRKNTCPGWYRRPVDTFKDLKDLGGFHTHCVEIRLANGTIIHQGAYPAEPTCTSQYRMVWKQVLEQRFRQRLYVRCCDYNLCNSQKRWGLQLGILSDKSLVYPIFTLAAVIISVHTLIVQNILI